LIVVYVNKKSGKAHQEGCHWIERVPPGALRRTEVFDWPPRLLLCSACFPPALPSSPDIPAVAPGATAAVKAA